ncbi:hypothetical protein ACSI5G_003996 [Vibrio vulnificus]|nr:phenylacetate--CoA ligase family protein [Vibrio vulnificus]HAS8118911.1 phenylacetate--CoA ligase family protein [Vibrio vulnificus]
MSSAEIEFFNTSKERLFKTLFKAQQSVPFYRNLYRFKLPPQELFTYSWFQQKVPILTKGMLQEAGEQMLSHEYDASELNTESTSGSEGVPLIVYKTMNEQNLCGLELWKFRRKFIPGLTPQHRFARFYAYRSRGDGHQPTKGMYVKGNDLHIPLSDFSYNTVVDICEAIEEFKPTWIHGPSTAICNIAKVRNEMGCSFEGFAAVELNGERVRPEQVEIIKHAFGCKVINNYGCREFWTLGYGEETGPLNIPQKSVYLETAFNANAGQSELLVTTLRNHAWPLIRYKVGDTGSIEINQSTSTDSPQFCLSLTSGRVSDYFQLAGGITVNAILFSGISRALSKHYGFTVINQYQVRKYSESKLEIALCINKQLCDEFIIKNVVDKFEQDVRTIIPESINISFVLADYIQPSEQTGKAKDFVDYTLQK